MAKSFVVEHRHITHRGRRFHFVTYDGQAAVAARNIPATDPAWFLVSAGYRWEAVPHRQGQDPVELDRLLTEWLETSAFADVSPAPSPAAK